jgi:hypothetical protein
MFSQEQLVGVKSMWKRGCSAGHALTSGCFLRCVVIHDQVHLFVLGRVAIDHLQKAQPLPEPMQLIGYRKQLARQHI